MPHSYTEFDSSLSLAMINQALENKEIKAVLAAVAKRLREQVLSELQRKEIFGLEPKMNSLAMQHSAGDKFVGALLPEYSDEYLEKTAEGRALLLSAIDKCLDDAKTIGTSHEFLALMKAIDGMAFVYDEWESKNGNEFHALCKVYIAPTEDEVKMRARRPGNLLAITYGIGTKEGENTELGSDLIPAKITEKSCLSGKARFFILPPEVRMKTWFEKLADQQALGKSSLPLIASPSNASAKVFMMSQGMGLFLEDDQFNLDKAQIFANCVMAYLVYCGHHSFLEVAEIWNRQLDFVAIELQKQLPAGTFPQNPQNVRYIDDAQAPEKKLPYAVVGNYSQFLHSSYRDVVIASMNTQLEEGLDLRYETRGNFQR
jgi:hypothetical protein